MDQILKERLPQLGLETMHLFDHGRVNHQFKRCLSRTLENMAEFPIRNGKPEPREITIRLILVPEVRMAKRAMENAFGMSEVEVPEIVGMNVKAIVKDKLPIFESSNVSLVTEVRNGRINDLRFNPNNSINPNQLEIDFDSDMADGPNDGEGDEDDDD